MPVAQPVRCLAWPESLSFGAGSLRPLLPAFEAAAAAAPPLEDEGALAAMLFGAGILDWKRAGPAAPLGGRSSETAPSKDPAEPASRAAAAIAAAACCRFGSALGEVRFIGRARLPTTAALGILDLVGGGRAGATGAATPLPPAGSTAAGAALWTPRAAAPHTVLRDAAVTEPGDAGEGGRAVLWGCWGLLPPPGGGGSLK